MKILVLTQYFTPDITAAAFRMKETADHLAEKGHEVTVVTAVPHKGITGQQTAHDNVSLYDVIRTPIARQNGSSKWNYMIHYISFMMNAIVTSLLRTNSRFDVVIATSPPLFVGIAGYIISKIKGAKFVFDVRDIWPDSAVVADQIKEDSIFFRIAKYVEKKLYMKADLISCVAQSMANYISTFVPEEKVIAIYNGVSSKFFLQPNNYSHECVTPSLLKDKVNILYIGNMGFGQELSTLLLAARSYREVGDNSLQFYLIGDGIEKDKLRKMKKEYDLENVIIGGPIPKEDALVLMTRFSALFLQVKDEVIFHMGVPSKVFDYMCAGKPILFGLGGEGKKLLESISGNIPFQACSVESLIDALNDLQKNLDDLTMKAQTNRRLVQELYSREKMVNRLEDRIVNLVKNGQKIAK